MSKEESAPKKAARKRVVKKGVRGTRSPRKSAPKSVSEEDDEVTFELVTPPEVAAVAPQEEESKGEDSREKKKEGSSSKKSRSKKESATIEFVDEDLEKSAPKAESDEPEKSESKPEAARKKDDRESSESEDENDGEERRDNSRRRGRNRRGGKRDQEDGGNSKGRSIDAKEAAEKAWEIYQGELEEEGVSLVDPRRAREVARRCLELAAIFCEERDRFLDR